MKTLATPPVEPPFEEDCEDEILAEVRRVRAQIWAENGNDIRRVLQAARESAVNAGLVVIPEPKREG